MKVTYTIVSDTVTPDIRARLARVENPEPALRRMGEVLVNWARQAFRDASKRPATWSGLAPATLAQKKKKGYGSKPLIASGAARSWEVRLRIRMKDWRAAVRNSRRWRILPRFCRRRLSHSPPFSKPRRKMLDKSKVSLDICR